MKNMESNPNTPYTAIATVEPEPGITPYVSRAWDAMESGSWAVLVFLFLMFLYMKQPAQNLAQNLEEFLSKLSDVQLRILDQATKLEDSQRRILEIQKSNTQQITDLIRLRIYNSDSQKQ